MTNFVTYEYNRDPASLHAKASLAVQAITFEPAMIEHLFSQCKTARAIDQALALPELQRGLRKMHHLTLPVCSVYLSSLEALDAHAAGVRSLCVYDAPGRTRTLQQLGAFARIQELTLVSDGKLSEQSEAFIFSLQKLERLNLRCEVSREQLLHFTRGPRPLQVKLVRFHKLLWTSILTRDRALQKILRDAGADINVADDKRMTLLTRAVSHNKLEAMLPLMAAGADPRQQDGNNDAPAVVAARKGHEPALRVLVRSGANPKQLDAQGRSLLELAIRAGSVATVRYLVSTGVDISRTSVRGLTPLMEAAVHGNLALVQLLMAAGADALSTSDAGLTAFHYAQLSGKPEVAAYLQFSVEATVS